MLAEVPGYSKNGDIPPPHPTFSEVKNLVTLYIDSRVDLQGPSGMESIAKGFNLAVLPTVHWNKCPSGDRSPPPQSPSPHIPPPPPPYNPCLILVMPLQSTPDTFQE